MAQARAEAIMKRMQAANDLRRSCRMAMEARDVVKDAAKRYAKLDNKVLPKMTSKVIKAIAHQRYKWETIVVQMESDETTDGEQEEEESGAAAVTLARGASAGAAANIVQDQDPEEGPSGLQRVDEPPSVPLSRELRASAEEMAANDETSNRTKAMTVFRLRDMHPLKLSGKNRKERSLRKHQWFREMRKKMMNDSRVNWRYMARNDGSALRRGHDKNAKPCPKYNTNNELCRREKCDLDHVCVTCFNVFHSLKIHPYGPLCPVYKYRADHY